MTTPGTGPHPAPATKWPAVLDGIGALVVNCALDPDALADKIPGLTWLAFKVGGADVSPDAETIHCRDVWLRRGLKVGCWVYCDGPPVQDVAVVQRWNPPFVIYDVEQPYKRDEGGHYEWAQELVNEHRLTWGVAPTDSHAAVTSYGGYKTSIDFGAFAKAGWPILAQCYDSFKPGDQVSYYAWSGAVYPAGGVHELLRDLRLSPGQAVYRPESIDS